MISFRKRLHDARLLAFACIAALVWMQFSGVHLHSEPDGRHSHIHAAQSPHHAIAASSHDHHQLDTDVDVSQVAAPSPQGKLFTGLMALAVIALLLFVLVPQNAGGFRPAPDRTPRPPLWQTSPPLRAPPTRS